MKMKRCGSNDGVLQTLEDFLDSGEDGIFKVVINYKGEYINFPKGDFVGIDIN